MPRKPWVCGERDSSPLWRYSCRHHHFHSVHGSLRYRFSPEWNAPLPPARRQARSFGTTLKSRKLLAQECAPKGDRLVSCYALFKWWLLLSQHPSCLSTSTSFVTKTALGALAGGLGCFPFEREAYPPRSDSRDSRDGIRSLIGSGSREGPKIHSVALPPSRSGARLTLKLFRGEPDISEFD